MKIRIDNIGARSPVYIGKPPANAHHILDIVQYYPCRYYGKLEEYLNDGWADCGNGVIRKDNCTIGKSCFSNEEVCNSIAQIEWNPKEDCTELSTIGERLLNLSKEDRDIFFEVYEIAAKKLAEAYSDED
jgi:hypothetical protein